jgi:tryptophan synthase alpha chain
MNARLSQMFAKCRAENRAALILYLTAGFPTADVTRRLLPVLERAGCDLVELGVPFSDPIADGPTIQKASTVALENGMSLDKALGLVRDFRQSSALPMILFGAYNPFVVRGLDAMASMAAEAGIDGMLAADLPVEEAADLRAACHAKGLDLVLLAAPTSPTERLRSIAAQSSGFLYCISVKGITGARTELGPQVAAYLDRVRPAAGELPIAVGFGISTPEHVRAVAPHADAVVVGSGLISLIEACVREGRDLEAEVGNYVSGLAAALGRG